MVLKEPIIFAAWHPHRRLPIGQSILHLTFSCLLYIYLHTLSLKTSIYIFLALQGLFAISPANMSHQDYSIDSSGKFPIDSCLLISDVSLLYEFWTQFWYCTCIFTDTEYEPSSDSGYSFDGSVYSTDSLVASQVVNPLLPIFSVELVPIHFPTPLCPSEAIRPAVSAYPVLFRFHLLLSTFHLLFDFFLCFEIFTL